MLPLRYELENITYMKTENETKTNIWTNDLLVFMGLWLIEKGEYGHGLLCVHGGSVGLKIGDQLNLKWSNFFENKTDTKIHTLYFDDGRAKARELSEYIASITLRVYKKLKIENRNEFVYMNYKTEKRLTTSTLNRELERFSNDLSGHLWNITGRILNMRPLRSNAFEIAWAREMVAKYMYTKKVFIEVNRYCGHRQMSDTYELLGLEPKDEINFVFNLFNPTYDSKLISDILKDKRRLNRVINFMNISTIDDLEVVE